MTRRSSPADESRPLSGATDAGFTLVELLVAMAVFAILMTMVSALTISGFTTIRSVMTRSENQAQAALAMESAARMLRYTAIPPGQTSAITSAGPTSITFYTYSGTGVRGDIPYQVSLFVEVAGDGTKLLKSRTWTPTSYNGAWSGWSASTPIDRTLLAVSKTGGNPFAVAVTKCDGENDCYATRTAATPATAGPLTLATGWVPDTVTISLGDHSDPNFLVRQQIALVNQS